MDMAMEPEGTPIIDRQRQITDTSRQLYISYLSRWAFNFLTGCSVSLMASNSWSGDWDVLYGFSLNEVFTDNICLEDGDKEFGWLTSATPSIAIEGEGGRSKLNLYGSATGSVNQLRNDRCSRGDRIWLNLMADGSVELLKDLFYVDGTVRVVQNAVDPFRATGDQTVGVSENINTTYSYSVSPYILHSFANFAHLSVRYNYTNQINSESELSDNERQSAQFSLSSLSSWSRLGWDISGSYQKLSYDNERQQPNRLSEISTIYYTLSYLVNRKLSVYAFAGQDSNDYESTHDEIDGDVWGAGMEWSPNPRAKIKLETGERFFGSTPAVNISYRHRRSRLELDYQTTLTYSSYLREDPVFGLPLNESGAPILDSDGNLIVFGFNQTTQTLGPVIDERLRLNYRWEGRRLSIYLDAAESEQTREEDNLVSTFTSVSLGFDQKMSSVLDFDGRVSYYESEPDTGSEILGPASETWRFDLGLKRELGERSDLYGLYTYTQRFSDDSLDEYKENRITIGISFNW